MSPWSQQVDHEMSSGNKDNQSLATSSTTAIVQEAPPTPTNRFTASAAQQASSSRAVPPAPQAVTEKEIESGGVVIDYDYARSKHLGETKTSVCQPIFHRCANLRLTAI
jgi:hypothetical protein